ncbi:insulinase family protein [Reichenbachiella carrageenanivorans]|uniref:Insulinase family protein n=1 Tax=Reichenbachiella carrageenanivorans TaxID=2979869 RepID=A0ABY6D1H9_9BACT|nr:M16 family metallopeptidase [Reichenbachiella carrageenanivorans]UXX80022.1 insulinase family protein [Reichenbachiella carrageenanivorans]
MKIVQKHLLLVIVFFVALQGHTQDLSLDEKIPFDPSIRTGTLKNGLKYFIKKNSKPEERVELRLVVNAGSVLEDDDQRGLAHFTEHMAFNGSAHFAKNELVNYLQSVGVKFGAHLNAYTSFDETVYILPIPSDDEIMDKGLTILEDWGRHLLFEPEEIEKERGVVIEEWRLGQGAQMRMIQDYLPIIFKGSKYAERLPIGTKETLETFQPETIKRFYHDWYRPDLMAVIAVGDIDVDKMESMIKKHFTKFKNPKNERPRVDVGVPDNKEPLVAVASDKEATNIIFNIMYKSDVEEVVTGNDYRKGLIQMLFSSMVNQRLRDLLQEANPPYLYASTSIGPFIARSKNAFSCVVVPKPDDIEGGVRTLMNEIKRVELHGFTASELKTEKLNLMEGYERAYKERDKTESESLVGELVRHFLEKEPVPGIEYEYEFTKKYLEGITVEEVNAIIGQQITEENRVVYLTAPEKEEVKMPTTTDLLAWVKASDESTPEALVETNLSDQLIEDEPAPGRVVEKSTIDDIGVTSIKLSNGAQVFIKSTDYKNDEVQFLAYRKGGISLAEDEEYWSASFATNIVGLSGVGAFSYTDLQKVLAGKSVGLQPYIGDYEEGFRGSAAPKDLETMLQLTYLYFTEIRKDESAFQSLMQRNRAFLANVMSDPNYYYQDKMAKILAQGNMRGGGIPTIADLERVDMDQALAFYQGRFSSPADFTFWFVGNVDEAVLVPLVEKYLGTGAPTKEEAWIDRGVRPPSGMVSEKVYKGSEPKSSVNMVFTGEMDYSREESYYLRCLSEILDIRLIEILREEKGGVYGVGASGSASKVPYENFEFTISFPCGPDNVEDLVASALGAVTEIQEQGVSEENLNKIKEAQRRDQELHWKTNNYWMNVLKTYHVNDYDYKEVTWLDQRIEDLTAEDLQRVAKKYLDTKSYIQVVLYPEE